MKTFENGAVGCHNAAPSETNFLSIPSCQTVLWQTPLQLWRFVAGNYNIFNEFRHKFCSKALLVRIVIFQATATFVLSVYPSVRPSTWHNSAPPDGFSWNLIFENFSKKGWEFQVSLKTDKNNGYCTWRPIHTLFSMRIAGWVPKASNAHSEYIILIASPPQQ
jgi:hypothetical protein